MTINKTAIQPAVSILQDLAKTKPCEVKSIAKEVKKLNAGKR